MKLKNSTKTLELTSIVALNRLMYILTIIKKEKYSRFIKYIKDINNNNKIITINNIKYFNIYNTAFKEKHKHNYGICIEEYFSDDDWNMIDFQNRNIIDISAHVADTALYFAKNGANVIAFEPVKHLFELGIDNITINSDLKDNITLINKAVGRKKGTLNIVNNSTKSCINQEDSYDIEVITIKDVLNNYDFPADILKMDCEGCEFEIILNENLTMFNNIIFEHHAEIVGKDYKPLIEKLEKDNFRIDTYPCNASNKSFDKIGIIHAYK